MIANDYPVAQLASLSLRALQQSDAEEVAKLVAAASTVGVFYVDLTDSSLGCDVLALLPIVYQASTEYFNQPQSVKDRDIRLDQRPDQDRGYKSCESDETFEMALDEFRYQTLQLPSALRRSESQLKNFSYLSQQVGTSILRALSEGLGLTGRDRLELQVSDISRKSDTALKFVSEPALALLADVGDNTHTDNGLISMVWCKEWGFKIKDDADDFGRFTRPIDGTVIIHVANTLQRLTRGRLHSTLHQVTQPVDGAEPRTFIAYNLRPYLD